MANFKKTFAVIAGLSMVVVSAGCSGSSGKKEEAVPTPAVEDTSPIMYNMFLNAPYIVGYPDDGGPYKKEILDRANKAGIKNFDFKISISGGPQYTTKLRTLAASGDLPEYFSVDMKTMLDFADQGLILPLDDLLAKYAPHLTKVQRKEDVDAVRYNGKIYSIPQGYRPEPFNGSNARGYLMRQDWLDNLGLKVPTTLNELHDVLKAFKTNDPDKNGKNDTYGISTDKTEGGGSTPFGIVWGGYGIWPTFWFERNGKLQEGFTLPETKQALKTLQDWYKEGLIDPDFPVNEPQQLDTKVATSKVGFWAGSALTIDNTGAAQFRALLAATPTAKLSFLSPPAGPNNLKGYGGTGPGAQQMAISAKVKDPVRLMKLIDWSTDDSDQGGFWFLTYGKEGEHYTFDKAKNVINTTVGALDLNKLGLGNPVRFISTTDRRWVASDNARNAITIANKSIIDNAFWKVTPAMLDYPDLDTKLWPEYMMKIILGQLPVDAWDEFVQKYYAQGGKTVEDQVNAAWKKEKGSK